MDWKEMYPKSVKPRLAQVDAYLAGDARCLFSDFNQILKERFSLGYVVVAYSETCGWKYKYGHSGLILINNVCFHDGIFSVEGIDVSDCRTLDDAVGLVEQMHGDGFMDRFEALHKARTERRKQKEKPASPKDRSMNQCRWPDMVSRQDLKRLYENDAKGMTDEELLNDIGYTMYARCLVSREVYDLMEKGKIKCLHCGNVLDYAEIISCACGQRYTYREYRRSYRANNMPRGEASAIFDKFIADWEKAKENTAKMRLIDTLIHEFHVSSIAGTKNRPVGVNLIQGTKEQVTALIEELAYNQ